MGMLFQPAFESSMARCRIAQMTARVIQRNFQEFGSRALRQNPARGGAENDFERGISRAAIVAAPSPIWRMQYPS